MRVQQNKKSRMITLDQSVYISNFLQNYKMNDCHSVSTPIDKYKSLSAPTATEPCTNQFEYQKKIESLMYAMTSTRPDIVFAASKLSQFNHDLCVQYYK